MTFDHIGETSKRIYWPSPQDYSEAVQTPRASFADEELRAGAVETTPLGLPRCMSGNFASVFCFRSETRKIAVRCFLHNVPDQQTRYSAISKYVLSDDLPYTVPFEYLEKGVLISGDWYPVLKMEWVDGVTLNQFVSENLSSNAALKLLASYFKQMTLELRRCGIAHGDLQHDNILFSQDELRLVDYDGMFVPALSASAANELGHCNYQHPSRSNHNFGPYLDNFSAWVIYISLKALSKDPDLWRRLDGGNDCLLFRKVDFANSAQSEAFRLLERHADDELRQQSCALHHFLEMSAASVPALDAPIGHYLVRKTIDPSRSTDGQLRVPNRPEATSLPDWVTAGAVGGHHLQQVVAEPVELVEDSQPDGGSVLQPPGQAALVVQPPAAPLPSPFADAVSAQLQSNETILWSASAPASVSEEPFVAWILASICFSVAWCTMFSSPYSSLAFMLLAVFLALETLRQKKVVWPRKLRAAAVALTTENRFILVTAGYRSYSIPFDQILRVSRVSASRVVIYTKENFVGSAAHRKSKLRTLISGMQASRFELPNLRSDQVGSLLNLLPLKFRLTDLIGPTPP